MRTEVTVRSRRVEGTSLLGLLYRPECRQLALDLGIATLKALHAARAESELLFAFGRAYQLLRRLQVSAHETFGAPLLLPHQVRELVELARAYNHDNGEKRVLVHGDLHPSHVIVHPSGSSLALIDLEAMRIGKAATNFAQLWIGYYIADPPAGAGLYERYASLHPDPLDATFEANVRAEMALRCHRHVLEGRRLRNRSLEERAALLLTRVLDGSSVTQICLGE